MHVSNAQSKPIMSGHVTSTRVKAPNTIAPVISARSQRRDEDTTLNPKERAASDGSGEKRSTFLSCKKLSSISTMNVRTLLLKGKTEELVRNFKNHQCDILGVVDHKLVHKDEEVLIKKPGQVHLDHHQRMEKRM